MYLPQKNHRIQGIVLLFLFPCILLAQEPKKLFRSHDVLEVTLAFDQKEVYSDLEERDWHAAKVTWISEDGEPSELDARAHVRGKTRAMKSTCRIPPLFLSFKDVDTKGTPFHKQKKIKLVTHCKNSKSYKDFVKKEYLAYRIYNLVTPYSFNVRLCKINYVDTKNPEESTTHYGFLIESIKQVAKRVDMKEYDGLIRNQEALDKDNIDKLALFQYMIGNLDWSVPKRHNIKILLGNDGSLPIAVPYDFDYSGFVDIPYAVPPEGMGISSVRTRIFRGLCRENGYSEEIQFYRTLQPKVLEEINSATYMEEKNREAVLNYVNEFYRDINNPTIVKEKIDQACRAKHKHSYEY